MMNKQTGTLRLMLLLSAACSLGADVPGAMNYQGRLVSEGALVNSNDMPIAFSVYDRATGGELLYAETDLVTVVDGLYSAVIGDNRGGGTHASLPEALAAAATNAWLEISLPGLGIIAARQHLRSAPFAMVASSPTWAAYPASLDVDIGGHAVTNSTMLAVSQGSMSRWAYLPDESGWAWQTEAEGNLVCMACDLHGVLIHDVTQPSHPTNVAHIGSIGKVIDVDISGNHLYVVGDISESKLLQIYDITNPYSPELLCNVPRTGNYARAVAVAGAYAYLGVRAGGLHVYDVSDPSAPRFAASINNLGNAYIHGLSVVGPYLYAACSSVGFCIYDVSEPTAPTAISHVDDETTWSAFDIEVDGSLAYVAYSGAGLKVYDISDRTQPTYIGGIHDAEGIALDVSVCGQHAYVAWQQSGVRAYDVSDPTAPRFAGATAPALTATSCDVVGDKLYAATSPSQLNIHQVSGVSSPAIHVGALRAQSLDFAVAEGADMALRGALCAEGDVVARGGFVGDGSRLTGIPHFGAITSLTEVIVNPLKIMPDDSAPDIFYLKCFTDKVRIVPTATGSAMFIIPVDVPAFLHGERMKLYGMTLVYDLDNAASYITAVGVNKSNDYGGYDSLVWDTTDLTSTMWTPYTAVPTSVKRIDGLATVLLIASFSGTGTAHQISISRISLMIGP